MTVADRIRKRREELGLTQTELAKKMGYTGKSSVSKIETSGDDITLKKVSRVAKALLTTPYYLMGWEDSNTSLPSDTIPILGVVTAGRPIFADENIIGYTKNDINEDCFGLRIQGDSMIPDIHDGDIVIVRQQPDAENGEVVVAMVNSDDAVCKRLMKYSWGLQLMSDNPAYEPLVFSAEEVEDKPVRILGKVVELRRKY